uniref:Uncharacterized protein n=1 Tax=Eubacterium plexicaudatum ASF492 TaxID=1235802 RepID=N2AC38_9FIRM
MQNLLNPVEDLVQVLKTPIKLAERSSLNRQGNSVDIASGRRIAVNDGYILTVKPQGVEVSGGDDPYDTFAKTDCQTELCQGFVRQADFFCISMAAFHNIS